MVFGVMGIGKKNFKGRENAVIPTSLHNSGIEIMFLFLFCKNNPIWSNKK